MGLIDHYRQQRVLDRLEPDNSSCVRCLLPETDELLFDGLCGECADDELEIRTGSRNG